MSEDASREGELQAPKWADYIGRERVAVASSWVGLFIAILSAPHVVCALAGRPTASSFGEFFLDAVVVELVGMVFLLLWPLKVAFKSWLYPEGGLETTPVKRAAMVAWLVVVFALIALLVPQGFFLLTGREVAGSMSEWLLDAGAALIGMSLQVVVMVPYIWATRRAFTRGGFS